MFRTVILKPESELWSPPFCESVLRLGAAVLMTVYMEYQLLYVTPDVITFACKLSVGMSVALRSRVNVRDCLDLFKIIEST